MGKLLGALNLTQILTFLFGTVLVFLAKLVLPAGEVQNAVLAFLPQLLALILVLVRKPSSEGGTTKTQ